MSAPTAESTPVPNLDLTPVITLLATRYGNDPKELAARLNQVTSYLLHEPNPADSAAHLRYIVGVVGSLAAAFDSMAVPSLHKAA